VRASKLPLPAPLRLLVGGAAFLFVLWSIESQRRSEGAGPAAQEGIEASPVERFGPGPEPVDYWHPDKATPVRPAYGGTLRVHLEQMPANLNGLLDSNALAAAMRRELHATLVQRDWEGWNFEPELAERWELSADGRAFTFHLRAGVRWHDGHPFDSADVLFSATLAQNPEVNCQWIRPYHARFEKVEAPDARTLRVTFTAPYFNALGVFTDNLCILPRHLYDLTDPDHPRHKADATLAERAREINENPCNTQWVGLGPYRLTSTSAQSVEAERFDGYFDPEQGGYVDRIVWRYLGDDAAFQALLNDELDFSVRLTSEQYFGAATQQVAFAQRYVKGYFYTGAYNYLPLNMRRPILSELAVRQALTHAVDIDAFLQTYSYGLARRVSGPQCFFGPSYDASVAAPAHDPARARELLEGAGWYDRDGDGVLDRDGQPLALEFLIQAKNVSAENFARVFQESLAAIGVQLTVTALDNATYFQRIRAGEFDIGIQGWAVDATENDPAQLWHSSATEGGSNYSGVKDAFIDGLIARGQVELDDAKRHALWRELHRYLAEQVTPCIYREASPRKFALDRALRGVQFFKITPGYALRRWYYPAGTPGTRATRAR
jgi:peptide/nickel transport system substrate-binding protein